MTKIISKTLKHGPVLFMMGLIFFLSHQSGDSINIDLGFQIDKVLHALIYAALCFTVLWSLQELQNTLSPLSFNVLIIFLCTLYGVSDEWHQSFIPLRTPSVADVVADAFGASCALVLWRKWR